MERFNSMEGASRLIVRFAMVMLGGLAGCGDAAPAPADLGVDQAALSLCDEGDPLRPSFATVQQLFDVYCVSCHVGTALDLTEGKSYANLVRRALPTYESTDESCGGLLVVPGDAGVSYLHQKISNPQPCAGQQMPRAEFDPIPIPQCAQDLIERWIDQGAQP